MLHNRRLETGWPGKVIHKASIAGGRPGWAGCMWTMTRAVSSSICTRRSVWTVTMARETSMGVIVGEMSYLVG